MDACQQSGLPAKFLDGFGGFKSIFLRSTTYPNTTTKQWRVWVFVVFLVVLKVDPSQLPRIFGRCQECNLLLHAFAMKSARGRHCFKGSKTPLFASFHLRQNPGTPVNTAFQNYSHSQLPRAQRRRFWELPAAMRSDVLRLALLATGRTSLVGNSRKKITLEDVWVCPLVSNKM